MDYGLRPNLPYGLQIGYELSNSDIHADYLKVGCTSCRSTSVCFITCSSSPVEIDFSPSAGRISWESRDAHFNCSFSSYPGYGSSDLGGVTSAKALKEVKSSACFGPVTKRDGERQRIVINGNER
nr:hypothetical protein Iba_chr08cCG14880 [Ipomoea batatas]